MGLSGIFYLTAALALNRALVCLALGAHSPPRKVSAEQHRPGMWAGCLKDQRLCDWILAFSPCKPVLTRCPGFFPLFAAKIALGLPSGSHWWF